MDHPMDLPMERSMERSIDCRVHQSMSRTMSRPPTLVLALACCVAAVRRRSGPRARSGVRHRRQQQPLAPRDFRRNAWFALTGSCKSTWTRTRWRGRSGS
jgi:hypothetical protein